MLSEINQSPKGKDGTLPLCEGARAVKVSTESGMVVPGARARARGKGSGAL